jgi:UPF0176 protein
MKILNIAGYQFTELDQLSNFRKVLFDQCQVLGLKGTILLSQEGINLSLAGMAESIEIFKRDLQSDIRFAAMTFRETYSDYLPFDRLKVKIKKEIITMRSSTIHPEWQRAPTISPKELQCWLDEKRDVVVLDTRNDYEVRFGTFDDAVNLHMNDFSEFPAVSKQLPRTKPIVMFCTGGIRCEKAALHLLESGFAEVYQLDGGILNYFKETGGAHFAGECFVFDQRIALDAGLQETGTKQCSVCQGPAQCSGTIPRGFVTDLICHHCVPSS